MTLYTVSVVFEASGEVEQANKFKSIIRAVHRLDPNIRVYEPEELVP